MSTGFLTILHCALNGGIERPTRPETDAVVSKKEVNDRTIFLMLNALVRYLYIWYFFLLCYRFGLQLRPLSKR